MAEIIQKINPLIEKPIKKDYAKVSVEEIQTEMVEEYRTKKISETKQEKLDVFNKAKESAFEALRLKQDTETQALGTLWQSYEDNDYTIPQ